MEALHVCLEDGDDGSRQDFVGLIWSMLPNVLSKVLIDTEYQIGFYTYHYFLNTATDFLNTYWFFYFVIALLPSNSRIKMFFYLFLTIYFYILDVLSFICIDVIRLKYIEILTLCTFHTN